MPEKIRLKTSLFFSALILLFKCRNKERVFITRSTPTRDIIAYHYDRSEGQDLFITFNLDRYSRKIFKNRLYSLFFRMLGKTSFNRNKKRAFILCNIESQATVDLIRYLYPEATIYAKYVDVMSNFFSTPDQLMQNTVGCTEIDSYCKEDCKNFKLKYIPDLANIHKLRALQDAIAQRNVFLFVGVYSKVRFENLCKFLEKYGDFNIHFQFELLFEHDKDLKDQLQKIDSINNRFTYKPIHVIRKFISYENYLALLASAAGIIDFYRLDKNEGHSFRVLECVAANKKLITNRNLQNESFFSNDLIYDIDSENTNDFEKFLNANSSYNDSELVSFQNTLYKGYLPK